MRDPNKPISRGVYILPNLFTTASLFAGFFSIILAFSDQFDMAAWAILIGAAMDGLDGKVARLTGTASQFGIEYDSLADDITFGVAPGLLAYAWQLHTFGRLGLAVAFLFCGCAALRLAPKNTSVLTTLGRRSLQIYVLPRIFCAWLRYHTPLYDAALVTDPVFGVVIALTLTALTTALCSLPIFERPFARALSIRWLPNRR